MPLSESRRTQAPPAGTKNRSRTSRGSGRTTSRSAGIAWRLGVTFLHLGARWRSPTGAVGNGWEACQPWPLVLPRPSSPWPSSRGSSRLFPRTRRALDRASRPYRPWALPGNGVGALTGSSPWTSKGASTRLLIRGCGGRSASTRPGHGASCMAHGGYKPLCKARMARASSGDKGGRKAVGAAPSSPIASCMTRSRPGCSGNSRPSPANALPRLAARMARVTRQHAGAKRASRPGWPSAPWHCSPTRHPSCPVRMRIDAIPVRTPALTFWALRFVHDGRSIAGGSTVSTAPQRSVPGRRERGGRRSGVGGCPCVVTKLSTTSRTGAIPSCAAGCSIMGRTTSRRCIRPSGSWTGFWAAGPCGKTRS